MPLPPTAVLTVSPCAGPHPAGTGHLSLIAPVTSSYTTPTGSKAVVGLQIVLESTFTLLSFRHPALSGATPLHVGHRKGGI